MVNKKILVITTMILLVTMSVAAALQPIGSILTKPIVEEDGVITSFREARVSPEPLEPLTGFVSREGFESPEYCMVQRENYFTEKAEDLVNHRVVFGEQCEVGEYIILLVCDDVPSMANSFSPRCEKVFRDPYRKTGNADLLDITRTCAGGNCLDEQYMAQYGNWFLNSIQGDKYLGVQCSVCGGGTRYTCDKTDGDHQGAYDIYIQGRTKLRYEGELVEEKTDVCVNEEYLQEYYCDPSATSQGNIASTTVRCEYGCSNGACAGPHITPPDHMIDPYEAGYVCCELDLSVDPGREFILELSALTNYLIANNLIPYIANMLGTDADTGHMWLQRDVCRTIPDSKIVPENRAESMCGPFNQQEAIDASTRISNELDRIATEHDTTIPRVSGDQWCYTNIRGEQICQERKDLIEMSDLGRLDSVSSLEITRDLFSDRGFLREPGVPICVADFGDVQCKEGGVCLQARNTLSRDFADNKRVYDALNEVIARSWLDPLGPFSDWIIRTLSVNLATPRQDFIEGLGVCVYEDRDTLSTTQRWIANMFGLDPDDPMVNIILIGFVIVIIILLYLLIAPKKPKIIQLPDGRTMVQK